MSELLTSIVISRSSYWLLRLCWYCLRLHFDHEETTSAKRNQAAFMSYKWQRL